MIAAESYKKRLETGLNFIEFNYMLLQSYDFLHLSRHYNCILQIGGNDQWGNILAGVDLVRKVEGKTVYGLTFPLITTASGNKMGKTEQGTVWLDDEKTSPYEYYQYWINTDDRDVESFSALFTYLTMEKVRSFISNDVDNIMNAKETLAFEATRITHGTDAAKKAKESARSVFYGDGSNMESVPTTELEMERLKAGITAFVLFNETKLCSTRSEARRLINEGGAYINGMRVDKFDEKIDDGFISEGTIQLRAGKKRYHIILVK
jgi:tyrosyl-tRNA synthetase